MTDAMLEQAVARACDAGVSHLVHFRLGDIHTVFLPPASFDVIMSLDVWCHMPRRAALLQRCATLLRSGGRLAFYDHVERQPMPAEQRQHFCALWCFPSLETPQSYLRAVRAAGLRVLYHADADRYYACRLIGSTGRCWSASLPECIKTRQPSQHGGESP